MIKEKDILIRVDEQLKQQITEVLVEYTHHDDTYDVWDVLKTNQDNTINIKIQEEKMYSKSEVIKLFKKYHALIHCELIDDNCLPDELMNFLKENLK